MRKVFGSALVAVFALTVGAASGDDKKPDLVGTYVIVGMEFGGMPLPEEFVTKAPEAERTIKVTADKFVATKGGKEDPAVYKIDTSKTPYQIDLTAKKGDKDENMYGIFKVDGDKLILCLVQSDKAADRPKEFKTTKETMTMIMTLKKK